MLRQGDVLLLPVSSLPPDAVVQTDRVGIRIEGERTGHAHQLVGSVAVTPDGREFIMGGNALTHEEHRHIVTQPHWYEVRLQRELIQRRNERRWD